MSFRLRWVKKNHIFINEHLHKTFYNNNFSEHFSCKMIQLQTSCQLEIWIVRRTDWSKVLLIIMIESCYLDWTMSLCSIWVCFWNQGLLSVSTVGLCCVSLVYALSSRYCMSSEWIHCNSFMKYLQLYTDSINIFINVLFHFKWMHSLKSREIDYNKLLAMSPPAEVILKLTP